ncbi:hypothetical protein ACN27F_33355 [Solwaraspora sp. WMMB335]|uniref:hypothetical protein n=1 Tax=Solwaraspora sp. WMMB335 TaxID=3404118 RepID=UPI003B94B40A
MTVAIIVGYVFCGVVLGYFTLTSIQLAVRSSATTRRLTTMAPAGDRPSDADVDHDDEPRFVVLLPMLREDSGLEEACQQFLDQPFPVEVIVAVTAREERERDTAHAALRAAVGSGDFDDIREADLVRALPADERGRLRALAAARDATGALDLLDRQRRATTAERARELLPKLTALGPAVFRLVEAPATSVGKVGQMNAGLAEVAAGRDDRWTYVAVYDADSRPDPGVLAVVAAELRRRRAGGVPPPAVFQQVSCYCRNVGELRGWRGALSIADALAQTRWALGFEYPLYTRYSRAVRRRRRRPLVYCVGHGCIVSLAWLRGIGGFPTVSPNDDLALGYLASTVGAEIAPVPALDFCDVAPDPLVSIRQSRFWYLGSARFHRDLREFRKLPHATRDPLQRGMLVLGGHGRNLAWGWRAAGWLAALGTAVAIGSAPLAVALLAGHLGYVQFGFVQTVRQLRRIPAARSRTGVAALPNRMLLAATALASVVFVLRSVGPLTGSLTTLARRVGRTEWKVER